MLATIIDVYVHESCMRVAVRVLHSCAFISIVIIVMGEQVDSYNL